MKLYTLEQKQVLPLSINQAWEFFSNPHNLKNITPPSMGFRVLSKTPEKIYSGLIIHYIVRPMFSIPVQWVTEITHVSEPYFFIDEQRFGPYKLWHHQHHFKQVDGGIEMTDIVNYVLPFGFLGRIVRELVVKHQLEKIFAHRKIVLENLFPKPTT